jgi:hypothetical protein
MKNREINIPKEDSVKSVLDILGKGPIRLIDGRYSEGFVDLDDLNKLIEIGVAEVYEIDEMKFVRWAIH